MAVNGRPTDYTEELADYICECLASSTKSLQKLAAENDRFPAETNIYKWMWKFPSFRQKYLDAKEAQGLLVADIIMQGAYAVDERSEAIAKQNLILNCGKWYLSKLAPKQFGEKKEKEQPTNTDEGIKQLAEAVKLLAAKHEKDY